MPQARSPNPSKRHLSSQEEARLAEPISWLPPYVRPLWSLVRMPKNIDGMHAYLQMPLILGEVPIIGESFGKLHMVKFDDHDLANLEAFPELAPELYLERVLEDDVLKVVPMPWESGFAGSILLNFL